LPRRRVDVDDHNAAVPAEDMVHPEDVAQAVRLRLTTSTGWLVPELVLKPRAARSPKNGVRLATARAGW